MEFVEYCLLSTLLSSSLFTICTSFNPLLTSAFVAINWDNSDKLLETSQDQPSHCCYPSIYQYRFQFTEIRGSDIVTANGYMYHDFKQGKHAFRQSQQTPLIDLSSSNKSENQLLPDLCGVTDTTQGLTHVYLADSSTCDTHEMSADESPTYYERCIPSQATLVGSTSSDGSGNKAIQRWKFTVEVPEGGSVIHELFVATDSCVVVFESATGLDGSDSYHYWWIASDVKEMVEDWGVFDAPQMCNDERKTIK